MIETAHQWSTHALIPDICSNPTMGSIDLTNVPPNLKTLSTSVYSELLRRNLSETKRAPFDGDRKGRELSDSDKRRTASRKISFKIKNTSTPRRIVNKTALSASKVQQLTSKYNELVSDKNILKEPKIARAVRRANSCRVKTETDKKPVTPKNIKVELKNPVKRRVSVKRKDNADNKYCVRAKISYLESPKIVSKTDTFVKGLDRKNSVKKQLSFCSAPQKSVGNVKAAIEIFEKQICDAPKGQKATENTQNVETVPKPRVPEKNVSKTKELVTKDGVRKFKIIENRTISTSDTIIENRVCTSERVLENEIINQLKNLNRVTIKINSDVTSDVTVGCGTNEQQETKTDFVHKISKTNEDNVKTSAIFNKLAKVHDETKFVAAQNDSKPDFAKTIAKLNENNLRMSFIQKMTRTNSEQSSKSIRVGSETITKMNTGINFIRTGSGRKDAPKMVETNHEQTSSNSSAQKPKEIIPKSSSIVKMIGNQTSSGLVGKNSKNDEIYMKIDKEIQEHAVTKPGFVKTCSKNYDYLKFSKAQSNEQPHLESTKIKPTSNDPAYPKLKFVKTAENTACMGSNKNECNKFRYSKIMSEQNNIKIDFSKIVLKKTEHNFLRELNKPSDPVQNELVTKMLEMAQKHSKLGDENRNETNKIKNETQDGPKEENLNEAEFHEGETFSNEIYRNEEAISEDKQMPEEKKQLYVNVGNEDVEIKDATFEENTQNDSPKLIESIYDFPRAHSVKKPIYESVNVTKTTSPVNLLSKSKEIPLEVTVKPNSSFLWRSKAKDFNIITNIPCETVDETIELEKTDAEDIYDTEQKFEVYEKIEHLQNEPDTSTYDNFEDLYDTVDPPKENNSDKADFKKLIEKTDALLKNYKLGQNPSFLHPPAKNNDDNASEHSYESFEYGYEKIETPYDCIKTPESLYESLPSPKPDQTEDDKGNENHYETLPSPQGTPEKSPTPENANPKIYISCEDEYKEESLYETLPSPKDRSPQPTPEYYNKSNEDIYETLPSPKSPKSFKHYYNSQENIYWAVGPKLQSRELPPRPNTIYKENIYASLKGESQSNCYESIYSTNEDADKEIEPKKLDHSTRFSIPNTQTISNPHRNRYSVPNHLISQFSTDTNLSADPSQSRDSNQYESHHLSVDTNHLSASDDETRSNCYESICTSMRRDDLSSCGSNRDSLISCDQQSNSLYGRCGWGGVASSDLSDRSSSDRSEDWVDMSDEEEGGTGFVIVHERQRNRKTAGWSDKVRDQWSKCPKKMTYEEDGTHDPNHLYESLNSDDDFDSFDSDSEDDSITKTNQNDSGVDMGNCQLPDPPNSTNIYSLTQLAAKAGEHMKKLRRNWSMRKSDITRSLSRMNIMKSTTNLSSDGLKTDSEKHKSKSKGASHNNVNSSVPNKTSPNASKPCPPNTLNVSNKGSPNGSNLSSSTPSPRLSSPVTTVTNLTSGSTVNVSKNSFTYLPPSAIMTAPKGSPETENAEEKEKRNSLGRKKNWLKFRRSTSMTEQPSMQQNPNLSKPLSTFYLTEAIDVDSLQKEIPNATQNTTVEEPKPIVPARRKTKSIAMRPQSPPPPTPADKKPNKRTNNATSWYAEVGLFKHNQPPMIVPPPQSTQADKPPNTCWYAEIGLYQRHDTPSTSSAENSGCSISSPEVTIRTEERVKNESSEKIYNLKNERNSLLNSETSDDYDAVEVRNSNYVNHTIHDLSQVQNRPKSIEEHLKTIDEQLYQFYNQAVIENACRSNSSSEDSDYDGYEEIGARIEEAPKLPDRPVKPSVEPPTEKKIKSHYYNNRSLWCEVPEVRQSQILSVLNPSQRKLQEAKFEIITSEVSYLKSLHLLQSYFVTNLGKEELMSKDERNILFGKVQPVTECSERLLADLEECWKGNILLIGICDVLLRHSKEYFQVYISYCENQVFLDNTLKKLKDRKAFAEVLKQLESSPACQLLSLYSFLMLPMQRVTRLPLLMDAVFKRLNIDHEEYISCQKALVSLNQLVQQCNEAARSAERKEEMSRVMKQLEFPPTVPPLPTVGSAHRYLVRSGELTQLISRGDDAKLTIGKKFAKLQIHLFLFEDVLVIGKRKGEDKYGIMHHCPRNFIELTETETLPQLPVKEAQGKHLLFLTLLENQEMKTVEMLLMCNSETDKQRWHEAFSGPKSSNPDEKLYESWDCPQVTAVHFYATEQPDELNLVVGDVINITKKMADGWYYGERIGDGQTGWFPGNHTVEIVNRHVRARNLKQRYQLLTYTGSYLNKSK